MSPARIIFRSSSSGARRAQGVLRLPSDPRFQPDSLEISRRKRLPHIEDRTDNAPSGLDHVSALDSVCRRSCNRGAGARSPWRAVCRSSRRTRNSCPLRKTHHWTGNFGRELEGDSFLRLDVQHELIGHQIFDGSVAEKNKSARRNWMTICVFCAGRRLPVRR